MGTKHTPDLLAALKNIKELSRPGQEINVSEAVDILCQIWNEARAVIAKAEGR